VVFVSECREATVIRAITVTTATSEVEKIFMASDLFMFNDMLFVRVLSSFGGSNKSKSSPFVLLVTQPLVHLTRHDFHALDAIRSSTKPTCV
jgi:hypothetical protein